VRVSYHYRSSGCCHTGVQWGCHTITEVWDVAIQEFSGGVMPITGVQ
jgi:hypothetical protein